MININPTSFGLGALFGTGVGVFSTRRYLKERLRAEVMADAEREIESMREHFERKEVALANRTDGRTAGQILREQGYSIEKELSQDETSSVRALRPPVPVRDEPIASRRAPDDLVEPDPPAQMVHFPEPRDNWDFKKEMLQRTGSMPYVIHHTEVQESTGFEETSYVYYPVDNVLVDEDGQQIDNIDEVVGPVALNSFGHGSEDPNVVFVRNNTLHLHIEIQRLPGRSYAVDVLGLNDAEPL